MTRKGWCSIEALEQRIAPAVTTAVVAGQLQVTLSTSSDNAAIATNGTTGTIVVNGIPVTGVTAGIEVIFKTSSQTASLTDTAGNGSFSAKSGGAFLFNTFSTGLTNDVITDNTGGNTFDFSSFTAAGTSALINTPGANPADTVTATKSGTNGSFTLTNSNLSAADGMSLGLTNVQTANLVDLGGGNSFTVSGWTGGGTLSGAGPTPDTLIASKTMAGLRFTLANNALSSNDGMNLVLNGAEGFGTASLTDASAGGGATFTVSGWKGNGVLTANGTGHDTIVASKSTPGSYFSLANNLLASGDGMSLTLGGSGGFGTANLTDTNGGDTFFVSGWTGKGLMSNAGGSTDTLVATKSATFTTVTGATVASSDGMSLSLSGAFVTQLTDAMTASVSGGVLTIDLGPSGDTAQVTSTTTAHSINVAGNNYTGPSNFTGVNSIVVVYQAGNESLSTTDGGGGTLAFGAPVALETSASGFGSESVVDNTGGNTFDLSGFTGAGSFTSATTADTLTATKSASYTLANTLLQSSDGLSLSLTGVTTANLTDTGGSHSFTVSGWAGGGTLTNSGGTGDAIVASKTHVSFMLANGSLSSSDSMNLTLATTGGAFTVATLTDGGGAGGDTFTVGGWTGGGTLSGGATDAVAAVKNAGFGLTNTSLVDTADSMSFTLAGGIGVATLTDSGGAGAHTFTVGGWTGTGTLTASGTAADTITATKSASFTLTNTSLASSDLMSLTLGGTAGFTNANLTDTGGGHSFTVSGWRGANTGTLTDTGHSADTVVSSKGYVSVTLTNTSLVDSGIDNMSLTLSGISIANLSDSTGGVSFIVGGWTGAGTLTDSNITTQDTVNSSKSASYTLTNDAISSSDGMSLSLAGASPFTPNLTDTGGGHSFNVSGWTEPFGSLTGASGDVVTATKSAGYTLGNSALSASDGMELSLTTIGMANLTDSGGAGGNTFTVSGWTQVATLTNASTGADTVAESTVSASYTLSNPLLTASNGLSLTLAGNIGAINLTNTSTTTASTTNILSVSATETVTIALAAACTVNLGSTGGAGNTQNILGQVVISSSPGVSVINVHDENDAIARTVTFSNTSGLEAISGLSPAALTFVTDDISNFAIYGGSGGNTYNINALEDTPTTITGGAGNDIYNLAYAGETYGLASIFDAPLVVNGNGGTDAVNIFDSDATVAQSYTITNTTVTGGSSGFAGLTYSGIAQVNLIDGHGGHTVNVNTFTGAGSLVDNGASADTISKSAVASFTLTNNSLTTSDNMNLTLSYVGIANLTDTGGGHSFTVSGWTGTGALTDTGSADTVVSTKSASYTLTNTSLSSSDSMSLTLSGSITTANLTDTGGLNSFTVSGWTHGGTLTDSGATGDTVVASKAGGFTLTNTSLTDTADAMSLTLSNIGIASLTDSGGNHAFTVGGWTGAGTLTANGTLADTILATKTASFTLANGSLSSSDGMSVTLAGTKGFTTADLTDSGTSDPGAHTMTLSGWTGGGTLTASGTNGDTLAATKNASYTLANGALSASDSMSFTLVGSAGFTAANLTDSGGAGGHSFTVNGWTGTGTLGASGTAADTIVASKNASFTLTNGGLISSDGMTLTLAGSPGFNTAMLADSGAGDAGNHTFTVSGWTGTGTLTNTATGGDTVSATKNAGYTLSSSPSFVSSTDGMSLSLFNAFTPSLTDTGSNHTFNVSAWTASASLTGTSTDALAVTKNGSFTLTSTLLTDSFDSLSLALSGIGMADLTDSGGGHSFTVSGWTGSGALTGGGTVEDTVVASKNAGFTLTNSSLTDSVDLMSFALAHIGIANLIDSSAGGSHGFFVSGWTGSGSLATSGSLPDAISATKNAGYTLSASSLSSTDGMSLSLTGTYSAFLTDTGSNHTFFASGWTNAATLIGTATDAVAVTKNASFTLTNSLLTDSADAMSLSLSGIGVANLTDSGSGIHSFTVGGWTGNGTLSGPTIDAVVASKFGGFTLTNTSLSDSADAMSLTLAGIGTANLTDTSASVQSFTVSGWTGSGTLTSGSATGGDMILSTKNAGYTLVSGAPGSLSSSDGMSLSLSGAFAPNLADIGAGHTFNLSAWSGGASLSGTATDILAVSKNASFTLTNVLLTESADAGSLTLAGIGIANLTDTGGGHTFTVSGWTGAGTLTDGSAATGDRIAAAKIANFTLANGSLSTSDGMSVTLAGTKGFTTADLTDSGTSDPGAHTMTLSGWTGGGTLTASGTNGDTLAATKNASYTLANSALSSSDSMSFTLVGSAGFTVANLTDSGGSGDHSFTVNGWTGTGTLSASGTAADAIAASKNASFTLANGSLISSDGMTLTLTGNTGFNTASLTDSGGGDPGNHTFTVSGWTGGGTLTNSSSGNDTVSASKNAGYTLISGAPGSLASTDGMSISLSGSFAADLTDTGSNHTFTVSGWNGGGALTGAASDTIAAVKNGSLVLTNGLLTDSADAMSLTLSGIANAYLTGANAGASFDLSGWTGAATVNGGAGNDTLIVNYSGGDPSGNAGPFTFHGGGGADSIQFTGSGNESVTAAPDASAADTGSLTIATTHGSLPIHYDQSSGTLVPAISSVASLTLSTVESESYTLDSAGSGVASLTTSAGTTPAQQILFTATPTVNVTLGTGEALAGSSNFTVNSLIGESALTNLTVTTGNGNNSLTLNSSVTSLDPGSLTAFSWTAGSGVNTLNATADVSMTFANGGLSYGVAGAAGTLALPGSEVEAANLTVGPSADAIDVSGWTGRGTLTGESVDTVTATKTGGFTLSNTSLTDSADAMSLTLSGFASANLTDSSSTGGHSFTVSGWTGIGTLTNNGSAGDTIVAVKKVSYSLTDTSLADTSVDSMSLTLAGTGGFTTADLTDLAGGQSFNVTGWTHGGTLTDAANPNDAVTGFGPGGPSVGADTVVASKNVNYTLTNTSLADTGADTMSLTLNGIGLAYLTDTGGSHTLTVTGWTGGGTLSNAGGTPDTLVDAEQFNVTLTNTSLSSNDGTDLALSGIFAADLTGIAIGSYPDLSVPTITVTGWTGTGTLTGGFIAAVKDGSFTLSSTLLTDSADSMSFTILGGVGYVNLTDTGGGHSFTVSGWNGTAGTLTNSGSAADTIVDTENAGFTLSNTSLQTGIRSLTLAGSFGTADLTDTGGQHFFSVSGWTGAGTLANTGTAPDLVGASKNASFTLTNSSLTATDGLNLSLAGALTVNLTDTGGNHTFTVSGWTGSGAIGDEGAVPDTILATKNASFTLSNESLNASDGMSLSLAGSAGITVANLTDTGAGQIFALTGWSGGGTLTGGSADTVSDATGGGFTLANRSLSDSVDGLNMTLAGGIAIANLTDTAGGSTFNVSLWTGSGTLTDSGSGADTVAATKNASFTLTNAALTSSDGMSLALAGTPGFLTADLTDSGAVSGPTDPGRHTFTVGGWTGGGALTASGAAPDTISATKSANFTLSNSLLSTSDGMSLALAGTAGFTTASLTDSGASDPGSHTFTVSGWTSGGALIGSGTAADTVTATKDANFTLTDTSLITSDGMSLTLSNVTTANLSVKTATYGPTTFDASGYSGTLTATGGSPIPSAAGLAPLGNTFYGGKGDNTLIGGTDQDRYILQGLSSESDTLVEPAGDTFATVNGYYEFGNTIDFSHMTTPTGIVDGVKIGVSVDLDDISPTGVTQLIDPALTDANPKPGDPGTLTLVGTPGTFDQLAGSPFKDTLIGNNPASFSDPATKQILDNLLTSIYTGGDTTAEDTIVTGQGGRDVIYGQHLPFTSKTEPDPGIVFQLPSSMPYFVGGSQNPVTLIYATHPLTYRDDSGNVISITLAGPGQVEASFDAVTNDPSLLALAGTTAASTLTVKIANGNGLASVEQITDGSAVGSIVLGRGVSLGAGSSDSALSIAGAVGSLTVGGINSGASLVATSFGRIVSTGAIESGSSLTASGKIGDFTVELTKASGAVAAIDGLSVEAASIGNVEVSLTGAKGALMNGVAIDRSSFAATEGSIGAIHAGVSAPDAGVDAAIVNSTFSASGNIASITATAAGSGMAGQSLSLTGVVSSQFTADGNVGAVHVTETAAGKGTPTIAGIEGSATAPALIEAGGSIASIFVTGNVSDANIFAGANLGSTSVKVPTTNAGLSAISLGPITITGSLTSGTPGAFAITATGNLGAVTVDGNMTGYALAAGFDGATDQANSNGRIAEVIVNGQLANSSIIAGVTPTAATSATPFEWGGLADAPGISFAGVTQTSRVGPVILGALTSTVNVQPDATLAHDSAIEAFALVSIQIGKLKPDSTFTATPSYIDENGGPEAAVDTVVRIDV